MVESRYISGKKIDSPKGKSVFGKSLIYTKSLVMESTLYVLWYFWVMLYQVSPAVIGYILPDSIVDSGIARVMPIF